MAGEFSGPDLCALPSGPSVHSQARAKARSPFVGRGHEGAGRRRCPAAAREGRRLTSAGHSPAGARTPSPVTQCRNRKCRDVKDSRTIQPTERNTRQSPDWQQRPISSFGASALLGSVGSAKRCPSQPPSTRSPGCSRDRRCSAHGYSTSNCGGRGPLVFQYTTPSAVTGRSPRYKVVLGCATSAGRFHSTTWLASTDP